MDLLLERDGTFYPVEVDAKSSPDRADARGIAAFRRAYPRLRVQKGLVLAPAEKVARLSADDYAVPWDLRAPA